MLSLFQAINPFAKAIDPAIVRAERLEAFARITEKHVAALNELAGALGTVAGHARTVASIEPQLKEAALMAGIPADRIIPASDSKRVATWAMSDARSFATQADAAKANYSRLATTLLRASNTTTKEGL